MPECKFQPNGSRDSCLCAWTFDYVIKIDSLNAGRYCNEKCEMFMYCITEISQMNPNKEEFV